MTQENKTQDVKWATIAQLEKLARNNSHDQRYQLRIMVINEFYGVVGEIQQIFIPKHSRLRQFLLRF